MDSLEKLYEKANDEVNDLEEYAEKLKDRVVELEEQALKHLEPQYCDHCQKLIDLKK